MRWRIWKAGSSRCLLQDQFRYVTQKCREVPHDADEEDAHAAASLDSISNSKVSTSLVIYHLSVLPN